MQLNKNKNRIFIPKINIQQRICDLIIRDCYSELHAIRYVRLRVLFKKKFHNLTLTLRLCFGLRFLVFVADTVAI